MVIVIELSNIVLKDLEGLEVVGGDVSDLLDLADGALHVLVGEAVGSAPCVGAGPALGQRTPGLSEGIRRAGVGGAFPGSFHGGDKCGGLLLSEKVVQGHHPGRSVNHVDVVAIREAIHNAGEHVVQISRLVDGLSGNVEERSATASFVIPQVAGVTGMRTIDDHPARVAVTLSMCSIISARSIPVITGRSVDLRWGSLFV